MGFVRKFMSGLALAGLVWSLPAHATTFEFSYDSGTGFSGTGQFIATYVAGSQYNVTNVTGTETDPNGTFTITGLSLYAQADNQLYLPPSPHLFTLGGIAFTTGSSYSIDWNLYYSTQFGSYFLTELVDDPNGIGDGPTIGPAIALTVTATPLPAAFPLFATGLGAFGLLGWRRKRKGAAAVAAA